MKNKFNLKKVGTAFDRLLPCTLQDNLDYDTQMLEFADAILSNCPILLDFSKSTNTKKANQVLSFLEGVLYAIEGQNHPINKESFLMGSKEAFADGSLRKWINEFGQSPEDDR